MKLFLYSLGLLGILSCLPLTAQRLPFNFDAKGLLVLSDADMAASAYMDGILHTEYGVHDALTLIQLPTDDEHLHLSTLHVPNSVTNWVDGLDISNDGKVAFVVDTRKSLPRTIKKVQNVLDDLPAGNMLYAIDIQNLKRPYLIDSLVLTNYPLSVDVNSRTGKLLIITQSPQQEIYLVDWDGSRFGKTTIHNAALEDQFATHGNWHPSGNYFAITVEPTMELIFYKIMSNHRFQRLGKPLKVGSFLGAGAFSHNGKYYLLADLNRNQGYDAKGQLFSIQFDAKGQHKLKDSIDVGLSPGGFALSPKDKWVVVSNMGTNFMPVHSPLFGKQASLTLLEFDARSGTFTYHDTKTWDGIFPEGVTFDRDGDMIAVTSFDYLDLSEHRGGLSFWKINKAASRYQLQNTGFKISVIRGSHCVKIVK